MKFWHIKDVKQRGLKTAWTHFSGAPKWCWRNFICMDGWWRKVKICQYGPELQEPVVPILIKFSRNKSLPWISSPRSFWGGPYIWQSLQKIWSLNAESLSLIKLGEMLELAVVYGYAWRIERRRSRNHPACSMYTSGLIATRFPFGTSFSLNDSAGFFDRLYCRQWQSPKERQVTPARHVISSQAGPVGQTAFSCRGDDRRPGL